MRGLTNWKRAWLARKSILGELDVYRVGPYDAWKRIGFMRYADEFWRLGLIIYKQTEYMRSLKIDGNRGPGGSMHKGFLKSFDDTSMEQVHELIMDFQGVDLGDEDM